ncbi:MAG: zinc metallopeptidase [Chitinophagaceae bacterium]|nr:MAG: zinc metallopeptidase [Chitinophagaceae bacterium]
MPISVLVVSLVFLGLSMLVSGVLKSKFNKYSRIRLSANMTGKEIAEKMLKDNGIYDVKVISADGFLSDHYNPANKTVNLSPDVYGGISISAAAVAAHECGHAVQHATAYQWLTMRSKLVPFVQFSSGIVQWVLLGGIILINSFPQLLLAGIILLAVHALHKRRWMKATAFVLSCTSIDSDWDQAIVRYTSSKGDNEATLVAPYQFKLASKVGTSISVLIHPKEPKRVALPGERTATKVLGVFATGFGIIGLVFAVLATRG